jgi:hypothetical protein
MATKKKAPAKKSAAKKPAAKAAKNAKLAEAAKKILPVLRKGETTLGAERDKLHLTSNGPLRKALTELLGSKKAYQDMMKKARECRAA